jgi:hypothetical protein
MSRKTAVVQTLPEDTYFPIFLSVSFYQVWRRRGSPPCALHFELFQIEGIEDVEGIAPSSFGKLRTWPRMP